MSEASARRLREALERGDRRKLYVLAMEVNVHASTVTRWLRGAPIQIEHAERLCMVLGISIDWLLLGRGSPAPAPAEHLSTTEQRLLQQARRARPEILDLIVTLLSRIAENGADGRSP